MFPQLLTEMKKFFHSVSMHDLPKLYLSVCIGTDMDHIDLA